MLKDNLAGKLSQRLTCFWILWEMYRLEPIASNPFLPVFIETIQRDSTDPVERAFVSQLLGGTVVSKEVCFILN